jgi:hypothetical protein
MNEKLSVFFDLAEKMNRKLSLIPMLFGSLGLQMLVDDELDPGDIDILVPQVYYSLSQRWPDLLAFMQGEGYELADLHEREFRKGDLCVEFGAIDGGEPGEVPSLETFANIGAAECPVRVTGGAAYKLLTLEQYLKAYLSSSDDSYRHRGTAESKENKDQIKIKIIQKALDRNQ